MKIQGIYGSQLGSEPSVMDIKWKQPCSGCRAKKAEQAFDLVSDLPDTVLTVCLIASTPIITSKMNDNIDKIGSGSWNS